MTRKTTQSEVVKIFKKNSLKPLDAYVNSSTPLKTECLVCGHIIFSRLDKVNSFGHRCGYCSGLKDADKKAEALVKKLGHTPLEPYRSALKNWKMQCGGCGNVISPKYNSLQQGAWGCKFCGYKKAGAKRREIGSIKAVAIIGKPNAGKSTLLNALLNEERAIVSDIAGTTRDAIEERLNINGLIFRLIDTAGIRSSKGDVIEDIGIERSKAIAEKADLIIHLESLMEDNTEDSLDWLRTYADKVIEVCNKADEWENQRIQWQ
jgi:small GTP-binding protein